MSHGAAAARDIALGRRGGRWADEFDGPATSMQVAAGTAAAPAARVATATTTVACPHCGSTNTKERVG